MQHLGKPGDGPVPLPNFAAVLTLGGLWVEIHLWIILLYVKDWAPKEKGQKPAEHSILRAQQMYFVTAPLHMLAPIGGLQSGFSVVFLGQDASRWSSFDNVVPLIFAKLWIISLNIFLVIAILKATLHMMIAGEVNTACDGPVVVLFTRPDSTSVSVFGSKSSDCPMPT